jgi:plastocyanin
MGYAATEDVQNVNASIQRKQREPRAGHGMLRLWLLGICGFVIVIGGAFLVRSRGSSGTGDDDAPAKAVALAVASSVAQVSMRDLQFYPATIEVRKGDMVEWKNDDLVPHTATSVSFNSGTIVSGQSWRHTFTHAGNFPYVCTFHPQMKGVVIVE